MKYNNFFRLQDFFCNDRLSGILPQFDKRDLKNGIADDEKIYTQCRNVINGFLNGVITENGIVVTNQSSTSVLRIVKACKSVLEAMFDNSESLLANISANKRVYTSAASISQIAELDTPQKRLRFFNEILDNVNYNPEFKSPNSIPSHSAKPYRERQRAWAHRVGYKLKEAK